MTTNADVTFQSGATYITCVQATLRDTVCYCQALLYMNPVILELEHAHSG